MSALKKPQLDAKAAYDLAASIRRARIAARNAVTQQSTAPAITPSAPPARSTFRKIVLSGRPITAGRRATLLSHSSIEIPEFREYRKKQA